MMDICQIIWNCLLWCLAYNWCSRPASADECAEASASSPFEMPQHAIPSYLLNIYNEVSNPRNERSCQRTYVSFVNLAHTSSSTCSSGKIIFNLSKEPRNDIIWHSAKVYVELMSASEGRPETEPKLRVTLSVNQTDLGNTEIETGRYGFIDISEESYSWWQEREYGTTEMGVNFETFQEEYTQDHCKGIYWRASLLLIWAQPHRRTLWNDKMVPSVSLSSFPSKDEPHQKNFRQKKRLRQTIEESRNRRSVPNRPKRSVQIPPIKDSIMESQKDLFVKAIAEKESDERQAEGNSFQRRILKYFLEEQKKVFDKKGLNSKHSSALLEKTKIRPFQTHRSPRQFTQKTNKFKTSCSVERRVFNFADLGFHSILAPKEYESGRCFGKCRFPLDFDSHPTGFTILASMQRYITGKGRFSCCVPTEMDPVTIFLNDSNGHYIIQHVDDMIVRSCGCR